MKNSTDRKNEKIGKVLFFIMCFNAVCCFNLALPTAVHGQSRPIIITADQPNVWTLEQAHYLLAQMHRRNLDLRAKQLDDLDANEINGTNIDILRTLLDVQVTYDEGIGFDNMLTKRGKTSNADRRERLLQQQETLRAQNLALVGEIARLESQIARLADTTDRNELQIQLDEKKAIQAVVREQLEQINQDLSSTSAPGGSFTNAVPGTKPKIDSGKLDGAIEKIINGLEKKPSLNASLQLDNYLGMQYEILAKQLTLLRDEVGPGERLLFLEIPQSINTSRGKADKKWAQTWYRVAGYTVGSETAAKGVKSTSEVIDAVSNKRRTSTPSQTVTPTATPTATPTPTSTPEFINLNKQRELTYTEDSKDVTIKLEDQSVRVVDLIPRQSSLNVNDVKLRTNESAFGVGLSLLFGLGGSANYKREREKFSQFVQQELYSSGFGKGSREFGWTFTPMPGASRLLPGTRTTFAILVVPDKATTLVMESTGCYFPRSRYQPVNFDNTQQTNTVWRQPDDANLEDDDQMCTKKRNFLITIPAGGGGSTFDIYDAKYQPVDVNQRVTVRLNGKNFPTQVGVMVGGKPLVQSIGLAQPLIGDDSDIGITVRDEFSRSEDGIYGEFERLSANQIIFWFKMPRDYRGTPPISIVAPGDSKFLNELLFCPDGTGTCEGVPKTPFGDKPPMFGKELSAGTLKVSGVEVYRTNVENVVSILIWGEKLSTLRPFLFINGENPDTIDVFEKDTYWKTKQRVSEDDEFIQITIVTDVGVLQPPKLKNPYYKKAESKPDVLKVTRVCLEPNPPGTSENAPEITLRLTGSGLNDDLMTTNGNYSKDNVQGLVTITNPGVIIDFTLVDKKKGLNTTIKFATSKITSTPTNCIDL